MTMLVKQVGDTITITNHEETGDTAPRLDDLGIGVPGDTALVLFKPAEGDVCFIGTVEGVRQGANNKNALVYKIRCNACGDNSEFSANRVTILKKA